MIGWCPNFQNTVSSGLCARCNGSGPSDRSLEANLLQPELNSTQSNCDLPLSMALVGTDMSARFLHV